MVIVRSKNQGYPGKDWWVQHPTCSAQNLNEDRQRIEPQLSQAESPASFAPSQDVWLATRLNHEPAVQRWPSCLRLGIYPGYHEHCKYFDIDRFQEHTKLILYWRVIGERTQRGKHIAIGYDEEL